MEDNLTDLEGYMDDEYHFLSSCGTFTLKRNCFLAKYETIHPGIKEMSTEALVHTIMCPSSTIKAKLINKFIKIMFETRKKLDDGIPALNLGYEQGIEVNPFFETDTDLDDTLDLST